MFAHILGLFFKLVLRLYHSVVKLLSPSPVHFPPLLLLLLLLDVAMCESAHVWGGCPRRPEEGVGFSIAGVTGNCDQPDMGVGIQAHILWKNN